MCHRTACLAMTACAGSDPHLVTVTADTNAGHADACPIRPDVDRDATRWALSAQDRNVTFTLCAPDPSPRPLDVSATRPPAASARRHRFADIRLTRNRWAGSRSLDPASIRSAAANRTCSPSRRARSAAVSQLSLWHRNQDGALQRHGGRRHRVHVPIIAAAHLPATSGPAADGAERHGARARPCLHAHPAIGGSLSAEVDSEGKSIT